MSRLLPPAIDFQSDARKIDDVPITVWKALYPFPYEAAVRREAAKNDFDPMLAAGLMRQESTFQADAVSYANAIGLMQVLPKTGKLLARQIKVRYSRDKLFEPDYNLELGMVYIAGLLRATGAPDTSHACPLCSRTAFLTVMPCFRSANRRMLRASDASMGHPADVVTSAARPSGQCRW